MQTRWRFTGKFQKTAPFGYNSTWTSSARPEDPGFISSIGSSYRISRFENGVNHQMPECDERRFSLRSLRRPRKELILFAGFIVLLFACSPKIMQWDKPPEMTIDPTKSYLATIKTEKGDIKLELYADRAPKTVNNFVFLANEGYYDNTTFHRVIPGFMAQAGDPTGLGTGGPGYTFEDEIDPSLTFNEAGVLAMANKGPQTNTNGSQFFITYVPVETLNGGYSIFGKLIEGMDVLQALTPRDPQDTPDFEGDKLITIEIEEIP
jgi:cyclophilin family peptidyl-prolyl cis-trans isomerase